MPASLKEILEDWGVFCYGVPVCDADSLDIALEEFRFSDASLWCDISDGFGDNCKILVCPSMLDTKSKIKIRKIGPARPLSNIAIILLKNTERISLNFAGPDARVFIGRFGRQFDATVNIWRRSTLCIGDRSTSNGTQIIMDDADVLVGTDCMLSDKILLQSNDQHGIVDLETMTIINRGRKRLLVGQHVWIGRRVTVTPNVSLGDGCIIGTGAVVTHDIEACAIAAGVPARTLRRRVSWCRSPDTIAAGELAFTSLANPGSRSADTWLEFPQFFLSEAERDEEDRRPS